MQGARLFIGILARPAECSLCERRRRQIERKAISRYTRAVAYSEEIVDLAVSGAVSSPPFLEFHESHCVCVCVLARESCVLRANCSLLRAARVCVYTSSLCISERREWWRREIAVQSYSDFATVQRTSSLSLYAALHCALARLINWRRGSSPLCRETRARSWILNGKMDL